MGHDESGVCTQQRRNAEGGREAQSVPTWWWHVGSSMPSVFCRARMEVGRRG